MNVGSEAFSTMVVDYVNASLESDDPTLPADLVEVCEAVTVRIFKRRDSDGRTSESFQESSITWTEGVFTKEDRITVMNYRRSSFL